ncbi:MAG: site-specific integrase, partial [Phenylobacterium sp.]
MSERHRVIDGKVYVYRRENSGNWQCAVYLSGRNHRRTTRQTNLALAMEFARDWYQDQVAEDRLRRTGRLPMGDAVGLPRPPARPRAPGEKTFGDAAAVFLREYRALVAGERNEAYVASKEIALRVHLLPFFGALPLAAVDAGRIQDYRIQRLSAPAELKAAYYRAKGRTLVGRPRSWRRPSRSTLQKEIVCLRQVLKTANRRGWLLALPDMSEPYRASLKISHRAWFSPEEYTRLYQATRARARHPKKETWRAVSERLHDYVLFMANTGLRPDECARLEYRDVTIAQAAEGAEPILEIEVRGKRGVGFCKSMPGAVRPFERVRDRGSAAPRERVFGKTPRELLNRVLDELDLKTDREGRARTAYSLRHTYIC